MSLRSMDVEGFMGLIRGAIDIDGVTEISGKNGSGKTSFITAIHVGIDGASAAPAEPIHRDADQAVIRMDFGDVTAIRTIKRKKGGGHTWDIVLQPAEGRPRAATQRQLHELIGAHRLDPTDFLSLKPEDKFKALQAFVPDVDFLKSAQEDEADFKRRTDVNREANDARAAAGLIRVPADTPAQAIDLQALVAQLQEAGDQNALTVKRGMNREALRKEITDDLARAKAITDGTQAALEERMRQRDVRVTDLRDQVLQLQRKIQETEDACDMDLDGIRQRRETEVDVLTVDAAAKQHRLDTAEALPEPIDTVALAQQIEAARLVNGNVAKAAERSALHAKATKAEAESQALTDAMLARRKAREAAIAAAAIPVQGLEFGPGEIRLHGVPFDQASTAHKVKAAFEYCIGCNPKLRVMWIRDASLLDDDTYAEVCRQAAEHQVHVLLETVRPIGENVVILEAGRVREVRKAKRKEVAA